MKTIALSSKTYGQPKNLEFVTIELPPLTRGWARIKVNAAGVNPVDARRLTGDIKFGALPMTFGTEFAGTITDIAGDAPEWEVGDEVLGSGEAFTHATVIDVPTDNLVRRPPTMPWAVAGSLAGVSQTAVTIFDELGPIRSLLVHGGAGGVGTVTIQLAREKGITVVATGSKDNQEYLATLGAIPVEYGPGLIANLDRVAPRRFDASIDMAGTAEATEASLAHVSDAGMIASVAATTPTSPRVRQVWRKRDPRAIEQVIASIAAGRVKWTVSSTYPFHDAPDAYTAILERHVRGKSVLLF
ncbi:NADP-dependent oxidoreductase [Nocardioides sp. 1609]|uniref:NADP-dependent oxidoreductase n=1 Tax=Nocardioides sp. 1609 TaxID=2508327 RepID=UPI00106FFB30|nr:NADP-dependent oxidoreductase [Nocardioides sp. 1609]